MSFLSVASNQGTSYKHRKNTHNSSQAPRENRVTVICIIKSRWNICIILLPASVDGLCIRPPTFPVWVCMQTSQNQQAGGKLGLLHPFSSKCRSISINRRVSKSVLKTESKGSSADNSCRGGGPHEVPSTDVSRAVDLETVLGALLLELYSDIIIQCHQFLPEDIGEKTLSKQGQ